MRYDKITSRIKKLCYGLDSKYIKPNVRSRRPAVLRCLHAVDATRLHLTMKWVVYFLILSRFGPRREASRDGLAPRRS